MKKNVNYKEPKYLNKILYYLYRFNNRYIRRIILEMILMREGAEFYSNTLRMIFQKYRDVRIGKYTYGAFIPNLGPGTFIGRYTSIGKGLIVINGSHPLVNKSTHPFFYNPEFGYVNKLLINRRKKLMIGNDVYIGLNVTICPAVENIGDGSVIAAGSVVIKDVPPFAVVGGNPAKIIKYRFSSDITNKISKSRWWDKDIDELKGNEIEFGSFLKAYECGGTGFLGHGIAVNNPDQEERCDERRVEESGGGRGNSWRP
jgi:virginiamycin A acetyltransferase